MVGRSKQRGQHHRHLASALKNCLLAARHRFSNCLPVAARQEVEVPLSPHFLHSLLTTLFYVCSSKTDMHSNGHTAVSIAKQELPKLLQLGNKSNRTAASSNSHTRRDGKDACTGQ